MTSSASGRRRSRSRSRRRGQGAARSNSRLYGGQVTAARDLQAMDEEVKHLRKAHLGARGPRARGDGAARTSRCDARDPRTSELAELRCPGRRIFDARSQSTRAEIEATWRASATSVQRLAAQVPADLLARYEQLRTSSAGPERARLVRGVVRRMPSPASCDGARPGEEGTS